MIQNDLNLILPEILLSIFAMLALLFGVYSNIKTAIGTSLAALIPPIGIFAVYQYWKTNNVGIATPAMTVKIHHSICITYYTPCLLYCDVLRLLLLF